MEGSPPERDVLLATKLQVPRSRPGLVPRRRLADRLEEGLNRGLVLMAPPGENAPRRSPDRSCRPHAVAATPDGGCWATLWAASSVVRLDRDGGLAGEISFQPGSEPHGIALGPDGSVWVALEAGSLAHLTP